ncbi:hypothetical protein EE612_015625 [Oryza sativa]|nr:hypothetical protein EE612_015625 [Oryza sativa]
MSTAASFRPEAARSPPAVQPPAPPLSKFKVALCQLSVTADKARNIARAREAIEAAAAGGAKLVLLPEIWNGPYSNDSFPEYAEDIEAGGDAAPSFFNDVRGCSQLANYSCWWIHIRTFW